jgi:hypothetical protein
MIIVKTEEADISTYRKHFVIGGSVVYVCSVHVVLGVDGSVMYWKMVMLCMLCWWLSRAEGGGWWICF